jgi:hypothetical protein
VGSTTVAQQTAVDGGRWRSSLVARAEQERGREGSSEGASEWGKVVFGRRLRSGAEREAAPVPLPHMLSCTNQVLSETEATILREWEALEAEHQRLSDWRTQLEECTKTAS